MPADDKWFARAVVMSAILHEMGKLDLTFPTVPDDVKADLLVARQKLLQE